MPLLALWLQILSVCAVALNSISTTWHSQPMDISLPLKMTLMTSVHKSGHHWIPKAPQTWELLSFPEEEDEPEICQSFLSDHSRSTNRTDLVDSGTIYKSTGTHIHLTWFDISMNVFNCMSLWVTFVVVTTQSQHLEIVTVKKKNTVPEAVPVNADIEDDERRVPGHKGTILVLWEDVEISIKFQFMQIEETIKTEDTIVEIGRG